MHLKFKYIKYYILYKRAFFKIWKFIFLKNEFKKLDIILNTYKDIKICGFNHPAFVKNIIDIIKDNLYYYIQYMYYHKIKVTINKSFRYDIFFNELDVTIDNNACDSEFLLSNNYKLKKLRITNTKIIPKQCCDNLFSLEEVYLDSSTKIISFRAFDSCLSLKKIFIPNTLEKIEDQAFHNCVQLAEVIFY